MKDRGHFVSGNHTSIHSHTTSTIVGVGEGGPTRRSGAKGTRQRLKAKQIKAKRKKEKMCTKRDLG